MDAVLAFAKVAAAQFSGPLSFSVPGGALTALVTPSQGQRDQLVRLLLGLERPGAGSVLVLGREPAGCSPRALSELRRELAVVFPSGGLIANLKVWENLVLPLEYHSGLPPQEVEKRGRSALRLAGYQGSLAELPGHLSPYQRRQVGLARAVLTRPRLIVYNGIFAGVSDLERSALVAAALAVHREEPGRAALFLTSDRELVREISPDCCIHLTESAA